MSNDLQTNCVFMMIDYDSFSHCHLTDIFFLISVAAKEKMAVDRFLVIKIINAFDLNSLKILCNFCINFGS